MMEPSPVPLSPTSATEAPPVIISTTTTTTTAGPESPAAVSTSAATSPIAAAPATTAAPNVGTVPDMKRTIVVCGATGQQGTAVVDALLSTGRYRVRAMTRDVSSVKARDMATRGCELVAADMADPKMLERAMDGAYGVFSVQTPFGGRHAQHEKETQYGKNVIDAAKAMNVRHLVYSSVASADRAPRVAHFHSKALIEQHLTASGVPYTILRPATFMENWLHGSGSIRHGKIMGMPSNETKNYYVAVSDIGVFAEMAFSYPEDNLGRTIELAGDWVDGRDLCLIFNRISPQNSPFKYVPVSRMMLKMAAPDIANMAKWMDETGFQHIDMDSLRRRHPGLRTVEMWAVEKGYGTRQLPRVSCDIA